MGARPPVDEPRGGRARDPPEHGGYRNPGRALGALVASLAFEGLCVVALATIGGALSAALRSPAPGATRVMDPGLRDWLGIATSAQVLAWIAGGAAFTVWVRRVVLNSRSLRRARSITRSPWSGAWQLVPVAWWWMPFVVVADLWRATDDGAARGAARTPRGCRTRPGGSDVVPLRRLDSKRVSEPERCGRRPARARWPLRTSPANRPLTGAAGVSGRAPRKRRFAGRRFAPREFPPLVLAWWLIYLGGNVLSCAGPFTLGLGGGAHVTRVMPPALRLVALLLAYRVAATITKRQRQQRLHDDMPADQVAPRRAT